ncbi:MAG: helix-turn-helix domain-containing protein [Clostridia bacterium]|nr:helix-turn-helix domain-containing protein [Clostridia bacterium]
MAERTYTDEMRTNIQTARRAKLSPSARLLWVMLVDINNSAYWQEWFPASLSLLADYTGLKRHTVLRARNELIAGGFLAYRISGHKTTLYKLKKPLQQ